MPKRRLSDWRDAAIEKLEARIKKLEAGPAITKIAKLNLSPGDMVVVESEVPVPDDLLARLAQGISDNVGFRVSVIHLQPDRSIGVFKKAML